MGDFFDFRSMITPMILKIVFAVLFFGVIALGGYVLFNPNPMNPVTGEAPQWVGILIILFGWVPIRIMFEIAILNFSIHDELVKISNKP